MHREAHIWLQQQSVNLKGLKAIDLGGRNVNGSIRELFDPVSWTAVDYVAGNGVDIVADIRSFWPDDRYELVVCTEVLEHVDVPAFVIDTMVRCAAPGATLLITAAAEPRVPHGMAGSVPIPVGEHYRNVDPRALRDQLRPLVASIDELTHDARHGDVYLRATAKGLDHL